jgi:hypothetical protein
LVVSEREKLLPYRTGCKQRYAYWERKSILGKISPSNPTLPTALYYKLALTVPTAPLTSKDSQVGIGAGHGGIGQAGLGLGGAGRKQGGEREERKDDPKGRLAAHRVVRFRNEWARHAMAAMGSITIIRSETWRWIRELLTDGLQTGLPTD